MTQHAAHCARTVYGPTFTCTCRHAWKASSAQAGGDGDRRSSDAAADGLLKSRETTSPSPSQPPAADASHVPPLAMLTPAPGPSEENSAIAQEAAAELTRLSAALETVTRERDEAQAEISRRKGDPITRLHNLAESCEQTSGAYDADEFHRLDDEVQRLQQQLAASRAENYEARNTGNLTIATLKAECERLHKLRETDNKTWIMRAEAAEARAARADKVVEAAKWFDQVRRISAFDWEAMWNAANQISEALRASTPSGEGGGR